MYCSDQKKEDQGMIALPYVDLSLYMLLDFFLRKYMLLDETDRTPHRPFV
jgi:hypothetical protein